MVQLNKFGLIGVGGYVAPRHLRAIRDTGNELRICFDPNDSVGIIDQYFPGAEYFSNLERFEREIAKTSSVEKEKLDFISICSPNYLHDTHIRLALSNNINVICEKPLVLFPSNLDLLAELEAKHNNSIKTVMQLRYHPELLKLKAQLSNSNSTHKVKLTYITPRGKWYHYSWKGDESKSGGLATNIGIHLFDLLIWLFGAVQDSKVDLNNRDKMKGRLILERAEVDWFLSVDIGDLQKDSNQKSLRVLEISGERIEFSEGFTDLHTKVYEEILKGNGLGIEDARPSIELVYKIRNS
ncbi:MAG: Gfo/Idh/MocA family oxidoreductase [Ignavibacteria bacterium]|nr:Gfo/Idh/MocA family oxidoreductase [Ignavibacteria bacterium]